MPEGTIAPLYKIEYRTGKEWKEEGIGWCAFGIGPVSVAAKQKARFDAPLQKEGEWDEVRVGLVWYPGGKGKAETVWSKPVSRTDAAGKK